MKLVGSADETREKEYVENILNLLQHAPISLNDAKNDEKLKAALDKLVTDGKVELVYRPLNQKKRGRRIYLVSL
mgnify:CR=1 FL=1